MADDPRNTFSRSAERYLKSADHSEGPDLVRISEVAKRYNPDLTADIATGAGHALRAAAPYSGHCYAVDLTLEMLQVTQGHFEDVGIGNAEYIQAEAGALPFTSGTLDMITCRIAPHHFKSVPEFLDETERVLGPEGLVVLIDSVVPAEDEADLFLNRVEAIRDPSHIRSYRVSEWDRFFTSAGLEITGFELFERVHPFQEWSARIQMSKERIEELEKEFISAPADIRALFKIIVNESGNVVSYTDEKGIFVVRKVGVT